MKKWKVYHDAPSFWGIEKGRSDFDWLKLERNQGEVSVDKCGEVWLSPKDARSVARVLLAMADLAEQHPKPTRKKGAKK